MKHKYNILSILALLFILLLSSCDFGNKPSQESSDPVETKEYFKINWNVIGEKNIYYTGEAYEPNVDFTNVPDDTNIDKVIKLNEEEIDEAIEPGNYQVIYTFTKEGYYDKEVTVDFSIYELKKLDEYYTVTPPDDLYFSNGKAITPEFKYNSMAGNCTEEVEYYIGSTKVNECKDPAIYDVVKTFTAKGYEPYESKGKVQIIDNQSCLEYNSTWTNFRLTTSTGYDRLLSMFQKGNYTVDYTYTKYEDVYQDPLCITEQRKSRKAFDGEHYFYWDDQAEFNDYITFGYANNDEFFQTDYLYAGYKFDDDPSLYRKILLGSFQESVMNEYTQLFAHFNSFNSNYGECDNEKTDTNYRYLIENNSIELIIDHNYVYGDHTYFVKESYLFYGIDYTKVIIPEKVFLTDEEEKIVQHFYYFTLDGICYYYEIDHYKAYYNFRSSSKYLIKPGVHEILANVMGIDVTEFDLRYGSTGPDEDFDLTGHTWNAHFDSSGNYVGKYASIGTISITNPNEYTIDGLLTRRNATFNYGVE